MRSLLIATALLLCDTTLHAQQYTDSFKKKWVGAFLGPHLVAGSNLTQIGAAYTVYHTPHRSTSYRVALATGASEPRIRTTFISSAVDSIKHQQIGRHYNYFSFAIKKGYEMPLYRRMWMRAFGELSLGYGAYKIREVLAITLNDSAKTLVSRTENHQYGTGKIIQAEFLPGIGIDYKSRRVQMGLEYRLSMSFGYLQETRNDPAIPVANRRMGMMEFNLEPLRPTMQVYFSFAL